MKLNHVTIRRIIKRAEKPLNKEAILLRWTDKHRPINIQSDLDDMVRLNILSAPVHGYYSLIKEDATKNG
jgi:hypothetical protein